MATYAEEVERYELDCPIYQSIANQKARNAKITEECMVSFKCIYSYSYYMCYFSL